MKKYTIDSQAKQINMFDERWYQINGEDLPSVTTYLEAYPKGFGYEKWLKENKDPDALRDEAAQLGTDVHNLIERTLKGETVTYSDNLDAWERYLSWGLWFRDVNQQDFKYSEDYVEFITYDLNEKYAGTVDLLAKINGDYTIIDWKTGKNIYDTAYVQTAAYAKSVSKQFGVEINKVLIVQLNPSLNQKGFRVYENPDIETNFETFLHTKYIWLKANKNPKPKYRIYPMELNIKSILNGGLDAING